MAWSFSQELAWLQANPEFEHRPATVGEFLGSDYLNIEKKVRPAIRVELGNIMGDQISPEFMTKYPLAMITGGIGIGKTTIASIVLPWLVHWTLCLKDPQDFFNLLPGSRIAFMQMSTSETQAKEVIFADVKARIQHCSWFADNYPSDPNFKNQIRFPQKDVWIIPGDSAETTFEGYNILGGILDEADSHKVTKEKDYGEEGYNTIFGRIDSRFGAVERPDGTFKRYGFLMVIGQMKKANGFAAKKYKEFKEADDAYAVRMTIWESLGWHRFLKPDGTRDSFWYDIQQKEIVPEGAAKLIAKSRIIEVPTAYLKNFLNNPEKALRDLAGIPPLVGSPFISLTNKIEDARNRWIERHSMENGPVSVRGNFEKWFLASDSLRRVCHIDLGYSANGDALGFAMGHVREIRKVDGEKKPYIVIDCILRMKAPPGREIFIGDIRRIVYHLKDDLKFKIVRVTLDGFQSHDTIQQFQRRRIGSETLSVDKSMLPYFDLRDALYEDRIEFPPYWTKVGFDDSEEVEILVVELGNLIDRGIKIDHPEDGSKDVADAVAGVVTSLMGDRTFQRISQNFGSSSTPDREPGVQTVSTPSYYPSHPAVSPGLGAMSPLPPTDGLWRPTNGRTR